MRVNKPHVLLSLNVWKNRLCNPCWEKCWNTKQRNLAANLKRLVGKASTKGSWLALISISIYLLGFLIPNAWRRCEFGNFAPDHVLSMMPSLWKPSNFTWLSGISRSNGFSPSTSKYKLIWIPEGLPSWASKERDGKIPHFPGLHFQIFRCPVLSHGDPTLIVE